MDREPGDDSPEEVEAEHSGDNHLVIYDRMVLAINRCFEVDEVKDMRDKAMALEHYARQAQNIDAERKALEVRIRAERRAGQLLKEMERAPIAKGGNSGKNQYSEYKEAGVHAEPPPSEYKEAKREANISDTQAKRWQRLAAIPHETFEKQLQEPLIRPSTSGILKAAAGSPVSPGVPDVTIIDAEEFEEQFVFKQSPREALFLWGHLGDFEHHFGTDINELIANMSPALKDDMTRLIPQTIEWLGGFKSTYETVNRRR